MVTCPLCNGTGQAWTFPEVVKVVCDDCAGKGYTVNHSNRIERCSFCSGTGMKSKMGEMMQARCYLCAGGGAVTLSQRSEYESAKRRVSPTSPNTSNPNDWLPNNTRDYGELLQDRSSR
jgi:DnaJ-class molecular chaperone